MVKSYLAWPLTTACLVGSVHALAAQTPPSPEFEAASVKQNTSVNARRNLEVTPGGRFVATYATVRELVTLAYTLPSGRVRDDSQISGGPGWINSDHFDVVAKAAGMPAGLDSHVAAGAARLQETTAIEQVRLMLRTLLADRFKLTVHDELMTRSVYALVVARKDGRLGPQLHKVEIDCAALRDGVQRSARSEQDKAGCGGFRLLRPGRLTGHAVTMSLLAANFPGSLRRIVLDRTGLSGLFDLDLEWTPEQAPAFGTGATLPTDGVSIFTAVREQLGLTLESTESQVDVLVIDRGEAYRGLV
jgi:uncharacterized protein (TIGR03435 family)